MHLFQTVGLFVLVAIAGLPVAALAQEMELPVLKVMAEPELRQETGFIPYQENVQERQALQHHIMKIEYALQNEQGDAYRYVTQIAPKNQPQVNMDHLPWALQQHILAIAAGLKSDNPLRGIEVMLQPFRNGSGQLQLDFNTVSLDMLEGPRLKQTDLQSSAVVSY